MESPIRILLVEDEPLWQVGVQACWSPIPLPTGGVADDYEDALKAFDEQHPDAVLLDWKIKGDRDGLDVGTRLLDEGIPPERIILISDPSPR